MPQDSSLEVAGRIDDWWSFAKQDISTDPFGGMGRAGLFQIGLPYMLFVRGLKYVTATQASLTGMLEPIANPLWVFLLLGEQPSRFAIAGAAVVLCAIGWHTLGGTANADLPAVD